ncbi:MULTISPECIES: hypothetical protein [Halorussus]|uniref:hypothetical protein n=1 Tax=Halorussus TaxID=1070314 RepID=UPI00209F9F7E|nr:hypothetical protein [Halorussus vallis]USZ76970.1 hypothetical protein NGM07_06475 [Halorussus vallis]
MKRRKFLTATAGGFSTLLAGCGARGLIGSDGPKTLKVHNAGENRHSVVLTVSKEDSEKRLINEPFELESGSARTFELSASGTFSITTKLGSAYSRPYSWTGGSCPDAPLHIIIIYGPKAIDYQDSACD